jgi:hypothetical protein
MLKQFKTFTSGWNVDLVIRVSAVLGTVIALSLSGATLAWADQIVLKDGDRITGEIIKKDGQTLTMRSKNFGMVTIQWDNIASVTTDQPLNVVLPNDTTVKANLQTQDGRIQVTAPGGPQAVEPNQIVALRNDPEQRAYERLLHPGPLDLWTITGSLNLAGTKGNAKTSTVTTPVNFLRVSSTSRTTAYFNSIEATALVNGVNAQTARAVRGGWGYNRSLTKRILADAFNDYEHDRFQYLDLRVVIGAGLGYQVWTAEAGRMALVAGGAWNRERFSPATVLSFVRSSAEAYWGDDFNYKINSRTSIVHAFRMFNNLSDTGQYRLNFDVNVVTQLTKWLNWNVSLSDRNLSNPAPGRKRNDLLYTTGLGFTFAR